MAGRVGQVFVMAAVIFSALVLLAFLPIGPSLSRVADPNFRLYFGQSFQETSEVYNQALADNRSALSAERALYRHNRFVEERAGDKGIDYRGYQLAVLPGKGEAVLINYQERSESVKVLAAGTWTNETLESRQSIRVEFPAGKRHFGLRIAGDQYSFDAATPRIVYWAEMEATGETWENTYIG